MDTHAYSPLLASRPIARGVATGRSLFQEDWWLQAASDGRVETVEVRWDALPVASLSFMSYGRFRSLRRLDMPPFTRTLGPVVTLPESKPTKHALNLQRVTRELRAALPPHDRFFQLLDPEDRSAFAFSLAGLSVGQTFTFRAYPGDCRQSLLAAVDPATRRLIKAGSKTLSVVRHEDFARFLRLGARDRTAEENTLDLAALERLSAACLERGQGTFLTVVDANGTDLAAVFLVWDERVAYYLVPFRDRAASGGGTNAFLVWSALNFVLDRGLVFDLDSYGSVGTARFMSSFGLEQLVRPALSFRSLRFRALDLVRQARNFRTPGGAPPPDLYGLVSNANARLSRREQRALQAQAEAG